MSTPTPTGPDASTPEPSVPPTPALSPEPTPEVPPAAGPRGSEGLTTAPPPLRATATPVAGPVAGTPPASDVTTAPVEPAPPAEPRDGLPLGAPAEPGRSRAWLPLTAVGLALSLLAGGTGWLSWQLRQQDRADQASVAAVAAARDAARLLFSYDHKSLRADFAKGLAVTTGDFREQYQRTTKDVVSPVALQYKAVVKAEVVEAAVIDAQADEVTALVFLNQATTSTRVQGQQVDQSRVRMRLVPRNGRWLVEEVKAL